MAVICCTVLLISYPCCRPKPCFHTAKTSLLKPSALSLKRYFDTQAVQIIPDMPVIKKCSTVLKTLAKRLSTDFSFAEHAQKKVSAWIDGASGALALIGGNSKVRDCSSVQELLDKDPKHSLLRAVKAARAKVLKAEIDMNTIDESVGLSNLSPDSSVTALFQLKIPQAVSTELSSEPFDDVVATKCASFSVRLEEMVQQGLALCQGYENEGDNPWKAAIQGGTAFDDVCKVATSTIFLLPGKELKPLAEAFEEANLGK